jgi:cyclic pyranopterin phosphate synthase
MNLSLRFSQVRTLLGILHGSRSFGGPFQANIALTNRCNIRCIHCYFYSPHIQGMNLFGLRNRQTPEEWTEGKCGKIFQFIDVDSDKTRALIEKLLSMGTRSFLFSGNGEPFMHKNILEFTERVKNAGGACVANTNGTLLDHATIDQLIENGFDTLRITTLAGSREVYLNTHPGVPDGTFERLRDNLRYLAERKAALGVRRPEVILVCVVIANNCNDLLTFAEFAGLVGADSVLFRPFDDLGDAGLAGLTPNEAEDAAVRDQLTEVKAYLESRRINHNVDNFLRVFNRKLDTTALYQVIPCYYGWLSSRIDVTGSVYPCCRCFSPVGNINGKEFDEIWNGKAYRKFRKDAVQITIRKKPVSGCNCYSCVHHTANLKVYRSLHPLRGRSTKNMRNGPEGDD